MAEPPYSPSYDSPEPEEPHAQWKWNHFEVRTLVCLIIKGEHKNSKDPMDLTDKLNSALNPTPSGGHAAYGRDIPHAEVQAMLRRILSKKSHAVDLSSRDYNGTLVTRTKVNAFMRNLGFDGSETEWAKGRKKHVRVETQKRLERYMVRKEGSRPSPRSREERDRRRMLLREPRAQRLLLGWGIGASFWEDEPKVGDGPVHGDDDRDPFSARYSYIADNASFFPPGRPPVGTNGFVKTPNAREPVAMWAGGFASTVATPQSVAIGTQSMPVMPGPNPTQQTPVLDYGSYGGFDSLVNPQKQPYNQDGGEQNGTHAVAGDPPISGNQYAGRGF